MSTYPTLNAACGYGVAMLPCFLEFAMRVFIPFIIMFACIVLFGVAMLGGGLGFITPLECGSTVLATLVIGWRAAHYMDIAERSM